MKVFPESEMEKKFSLIGMVGVLVLLTYLFFSQLGVLKDMNHTKAVMYEDGKYIRYLEKTEKHHIKIVSQHRETIKYLERELGTAEQAEMLLLEKRIAKLQPKLDPAVRKDIIEAVYRHRGDLSPSLVVHLICRETVPRFNPLSRSTKGAIGLMQVRYKIHVKDIPELAKIKLEELYHIDNNIKFGCWILRGYIDSTKSLDKALRKYVGGEVSGYVADIYRLMVEYEVNKK